MKRIIACLVLICSPLKVLGQVPTDDQADSILIEKIEDSVEPDKVLHAEPLFIDLIRDLGARKGKMSEILAWDLQILNLMMSMNF